MNWSEYDNEEWNRGFNAGGRAAFKEQDAAMNLARGLAIEQAAHKVSKYCGLCEGLSAIRSLDPDAAQALAARDREQWTKGFELAHELQKCGHSRGDCRDPNYDPNGTECESRCIGCERESEIERRARLDEAGRRNQHDEWCEDNRHEQCLCGKRRIAALSDSQPAPAKEGEK